MRKIIRNKRKKKLSTLKYSYTTGGDNSKKVSNSTILRNPDKIINQSGVVANRSVADRSVANRRVANRSVANRSVADRSNEEKLTVVNGEINFFKKQLNKLFSKKNNMERLQMEEEARKNNMERLQMEEEARKNNMERLQMEEEARSTLQSFAKRRLTRLKYVDDVNKARIKEEEIRKSEQKTLYNDISNVEEHLKKLHMIKNGLVNTLTDGFSTIFPFTETKPNTSMHKSTRIPSSSREVSTSIEVSTKRPSKRIPSTSSMRKSIPIDNSELIMRNLQTILVTLADVWNGTINYDKENNTIKITIAYSNFNFQFKDISSIKTLFTKKYDTISFACYLANCSQEIKDLFNKLKYSTDDKVTYNIIIDLLKQYIKENINKDDLKPEEKEALKKIKYTIDSLEKIGGGKLRKVRKTNVIKKITTKVIRNRKL